MRVFAAATLSVTLLLGQAVAPLPAPELNQLYTAALHTFTLVRSGTAVDDPATGIHHPASHLSDATPADEPAPRSLAGGWYNAGDFGKWSMMAAISVSYMLHLRDLQQLHGQPDPNLLIEADWGLAWLLKMQDPDGGVRQKIDSGTYQGLGQSWGHSPDQDPTTRRATPAATIPTADFAAVLYQAARAYTPLDPSRAHRFRQAADAAYVWLGQHPNTPAHDPFYADDDPKEELLWARCEHALTTGRDPDALAQQLTTLTPGEVRWTDPSLLGLYSLASSPAAPAALKRAATDAILRAATQQAADAARRPFHVALPSDDYWWGSAERVLQRGSLFAMADHLQPSPLFHQAAIDQLNWALGNNALHHSFITGFGTNPVQHPYHWTYMALGKLMPGWAVGGPNASPNWADKPLLHLQQMGTPPELCYLDLCSREGSWASNEGEISEEAALVFLTGALQLGRATPAKTR